MKRALLLTGKPGTGKTALIKEALTRTKVKGGGFYTEEIRTGGIRQGFRIVTLDGQEAMKDMKPIPANGKIHHITRSCLIMFNCI